MKDEGKTHSEKPKSSSGDRYIPSDIEQKWRSVWKEHRLYAFKRTHPDKKPFYTLVELPYPSGDLHIGHWFTFVAPDVLSRFLTMKGEDVFFPMGYDAFGLPAENAAIKRNIHPQDWTLKNIETMTKQFETMGTMIDWDHVTITCKPEYYKWNQWIFQKMYEKGIAYRGKTLSNWCPTDQTVLANEHVENGKCWRCGSIVIQKEVEQWFLKITDYAEKLLWNKDGNGVDWPNSVMTAQNEWIGKSEGAKVNFPIKDQKEHITVFTTRLDTIYGATFLVLAPEHPAVDLVTTSDKREEVQAYRKAAAQKTEMDRKENKEKTGVFTGGYVINPVSGEEVPVWVADYVLAGYGTGAVMAVPAHDERDYEFAKKFGLPIKIVIQPEKYELVSKIQGVGKGVFYKEINLGDQIKRIRLADKKEELEDSGDKGEIREEALVELGKLVNSGKYTDLDSLEARKKILGDLKAKDMAEKEIIYHLRDWSVSRQRYWGTPVPMIHCEKCGMVSVPEKDLPVTLPYDVDYQPKGKPPLASNPEWLKTTCPKCGGEAERDPETLDTFFDSSWYYYRYIDPGYNKGPFDPEKVKEFMPVDIYFGGGEHTLGHTLYARFFTKFFKDLGLLDFDEFAKKRVQHGIVLGPDGNKMSKSKGNVINPDDVVKEFGTDAVRVYLSFMMPYSATGPWSTTSMYGSFRFLKRVWDLQHKIKDSRFTNQEGVTRDGEPLKRQDFVLTNKDLYEMHRTIKKVTEDIAETRNNTAVAALMEWLNFLEGKVNTGSGVVTEEEYKTFLLLLAPVAPFMTEEIWQKMFAEKEKFVSIHQQSWPMFDKKYLVADTAVVAVQVNGKLRETVSVPAESTEESVVSLAKTAEKVQKFLDGKKLFKTIYVPGKIVNFVVKD